MMRRTMLLAAAVTAALAVLAPAASATDELGVRFWRIPTPRSQPIGIAAGNDGVMWFTEENASKVGRVTPAGVITEYALPTEGEPTAITQGPDGNMWVAEGPNGRIGQVLPDGTINDIVYATFDASQGITTGPDGNIWFTDSTTSTVWRYTIATGKLDSFATPTPASFPTDIISGPDGKLWFIEGGADKLATITVSGKTHEFAPTLGTPQMLTTGPDGNVWLTDAFPRQIDRVTPKGHFTFFAVPFATLDDIVAAPDGTLWFTSEFDDTVGLITTDGFVGTVLQRSGVGPTGLAFAQGTKRVRAWVLGFKNNRIYRLTPA
jgi:streptogramin lyase